MHAMLAYASKGLDFLRCSEPSNDTTEHTFKAVQAVNKLLPTASTDCKDSVILSIGMLAWAEVCSDECMSGLLVGS